MPFRWSRISALGHAATVVGLALGFAVICLAPHLGRLSAPSLFSDDVTRVTLLQTSPVRSLLFRPFNEHMAPAFEVVSWVTWQLAGRRLAAAPLAFTVASFVPFVLSMVMLGLVVRRELGSPTTALAAVALFGLSSLYAETIYWYSASSFTWALVGTLATLLAVASGRRTGIRAVPGMGAAMLAAALAPACSAIGLLAGPVGTFRALAAPRPPGRWRDRAVAVVPMLGTLVYLALCSAFRYRDVVAGSLEQNADLRAGLVGIARGPIDVLLPGLFGLRNLDWALIGGLDLALFGVALAMALTWARSSRQRPVILSGLLLMLGGYALTYCVRTVHGPHWILMVQRYHLFPQAGLVLLLAPAVQPALARFDARPGLALGAASVLAALLLAAHLPEFRRHAADYRFPDQHRTLAALERLDAICRDRGITRLQALAALDPIRTRWFPHDFNALSMLASSVAVPRVPDAQVRPVLVAALTPAEREALCGGMDASPFLRPSRRYAETAPAAVGHLVRSRQFRPGGLQGRFVAAGAPAVLEFQMVSAEGSAGAGARALCIPGVATAQRALEVWWTDDQAAWSETRSLRWRTDPGRPDQDWAVPLDRLPHWDPSRVRWIRLVARAHGPRTVGTPRLLR